MAYEGPLRGEPIALELHNTLYMVGGAPRDGLASEESAQAWLDGLADRLPAGAGAWPAEHELIALRSAVRAALRAAAEGTAPASAALDAINRASAGDARSPVILWNAGADPVAGIDHHGADHRQIVLAAFARDAIGLLTTRRRADLRTCGAPGCVLMFLRTHPRREWCSEACGNRARQARHYERHRS